MNERKARRAGNPSAFRRSCRRRSRSSGAGSDRSRPGRDCSRADDVQSSRSASRPCWLRINPRCRLVAPAGTRFEAGRRRLKWRTYVCVPRTTSGPATHMSPWPLAPIFATRTSYPEVLADGERNAVRYGQLSFRRNKGRAGETSRARASHQSAIMCCRAARASSQSARNPRDARDRFFRSRAVCTCRPSSG